MCLAPLSERDALDADFARARAFDLGAHRVEAIGEVGDLRLARGVRQHRVALRQHRRQHRVLGGADRHERKLDFGALEPAQRRRLHIALLDDGYRRPSPRTPSGADPPGARRWRSRPAATPSRAQPAPAAARAH